MILKRFEIPTGGAGDICKRLTLDVWNGEYEFPDLPSNPARILDIGSGWGAFAVWALSKWPEAHITGYDPHALACTLAKKNAPSATFINAAVTSQAQAELFGIEGDDWGLMSTHFSDCGRAGRKQVETIHPVSLPPCDLLKIDAEGVEAEILAAYPHEIKAVVYEWHSTGLQDECKKICEGLGLKNLGNKGTVSLWVKS